MVRFCLLIAGENALADQNGKNAVGSGDMEATRRRNLGKFYTTVVMLGYGSNKGDGSEDALRAFSSEFSCGRFSQNGLTFLRFISNEGLAVIAVSEIGCQNFFYYIKNLLSHYDKSEPCSDIKLPRLVQVVCLRIKAAKVLTLTGIRLILTLIIGNLMFLLKM